MRLRHPLRVLPLAASDVISAFTTAVVVDGPYTIAVLSFVLGISEVDRLVGDGSGGSVSGLTAKDVSIGTASSDRSDSGDTRSSHMACRVRIPAGRPT